MLSLWASYTIDPLAVIPSRSLSFWPIFNMPSRLEQSAVQILSLSPFGRMLTTAPQISSLYSSNASPIKHSILGEKEKDGVMSNGKKYFVENLPLRANSCLAQMISVSCPSWWATDHHCYSLDLPTWVWFQPWIMSNHSLLKAHWLIWCDCVFWRGNKIRSQYGNCVTFTWWATYDQKSSMVSKWITSRWFSSHPLALSGLKNHKVHWFWRGCLINMSVSRMGSSVSPSPWATEGWLCSCK